MFENSVDLLNTTKAISIFLFVVFVCFCLYYLAMILRQTFLGIKEMRLRIKKIDEIAHAFKERIENSASYLILISEGIKKLIEVIGEKSEKRKRKKEEE
ncbi:MAG: hypothetical protein NTW06_01935 [Candidatus Falkowbacteria bacterium]|nr:hypothetical protein [Candidatus Falkowbacteria bacterium]